MKREIDRLESGVFDVVVVGGGMHGTWVAARAAQAGLSVCLVEMSDFGAATSANSLNILHGGLRYLQHLDLGRMRTSIRARREFARQSPHLVAPLPCLMPLQVVGLRSPWIFGPALALNDVISYDRNSGVLPDARLPKGILKSRRSCRAAANVLADRGDIGGALWWDLLALDSARLVLETVRVAASEGVVVANRVEALEYRIHNNRVSGIIARDTPTGRIFDVHAQVVVNATGPWADRLSRIAGLPCDFVEHGWIGGLNVVLRRPFVDRMAVALSAVRGDRCEVARPASKRRELFFVPWNGVSMIGTGYQRLRSPIEEFAGPTGLELEAFLDDIHHAAPQARFSTEDIARVHWGVLPADASADAPSRSPIVASGRKEAGADGLVVVIGEKLTSGPILSLRVLQMIRDELTRRPRLHGRQSLAGDSELNESIAAAIDIPLAVRDRLISRYGAMWTDVVRSSRDAQNAFEPIDSNTSVLRVELTYAIREEMAISLGDLVFRRLGLGRGGHPGVDLLSKCGNLAATEFGWTAAEQAQEVERVERDLRSLWSVEG